MTKGAGFCRAGSAPAGYGFPGTSPANVQVPLPDPLTGLPLTGRLLNPETGDYSFTADGRIQGMRTSNQLVMLALLDGNIMAGIQTKTANYQRQVANRVNTALSPLIAKGWIELIAVNVEDPSSPPGYTTSATPDASIGTVVWRDLTLTAPGAQGAKTKSTFTSPIPVT